MPRVSIKSCLDDFMNPPLLEIGVEYGSVVPDAPEADSHPPIMSAQVLWYSSVVPNAYMQESQFWKLYKEDQQSCSIVMRTSAGLVFLLTCLLEPFMASFSLEVFKQLNLSLECALLCNAKGDLDRAKRPWEILPSGRKIGMPEPLFSCSGREQLLCKE